MQYASIRPISLSPEPPQPIKHQERNTSVFPPFGFRGGHLHRIPALRTAGSAARTSVLFPVSWPMPAAYPQGPGSKEAAEKPYRELRPVPRRWSSSPCGSAQLPSSLRLTWAMASHLEFCSLPSLFFLPPERPASAQPCFSFRTCRKAQNCRTLSIGPPGVEEGSAPCVSKET